MKKKKSKQRLRLARAQKSSHSRPPFNRERKRTWSTCARRVRDCRSHGVASKVAGKKEGLEGKCVSRLLFDNSFPPFRTPHADPLSQNKPLQVQGDTIHNEKLTEDGGRVDGGGGPDTAVGRGPQLQLAVDAADGEGQSGPGGARNRLLLVACGALASAERALWESGRGTRGEKGVNGRVEGRRKGGVVILLFPTSPRPCFLLLRFSTLISLSPWRPCRRGPCRTRVP